MYSVGLAEFFSSSALPVLPIPEEKLLLSEINTYCIVMKCLVVGVTIMKRQLMNLSFSSKLPPSLATDVRIMTEMPSNQLE